MGSTSPWRPAALGAISPVRTTPPRGTPGTPRRWSLVVELGGGAERRGSTSLSVAATDLSFLGSCQVAAKDLRCRLAADVASSGRSASASARTATPREISEPARRRAGSLGRVRDTPALAYCAPQIVRSRCSGGPGTTALTAIALALEGSVATQPSEEERNDVHNGPIPETHHRSEAGTAGRVIARSAPAARSYPDRSRGPRRIREYPQRSR
jgi:hypothetical protein